MSLLLSLGEFLLVFSLRFAAGDGELDSTIPVQHNKCMCVCEYEMYLESSVQNYKYHSLLLLSVVHVTVADDVVLCSELTSISDLLPSPVFRPTEDRHWLDIVSIRYDHRYGNVYHDLVNIATRPVN